MALPGKTRIGQLPDCRPIGEFRLVLLPFSRMFRFQPIHRPTPSRIPERLP